METVEHKGRILKLFALLYLGGFMAYELLKVPQFKKKEPRFHADTFFDNIYDS